jgi:hypothetical protein
VWGVTVVQWAGLQGRDSLTEERGEVSEVGGTEVTRGRRRPLHGGQRDGSRVQCVISALLFSL